ncbi:MAG: regulatory protein RecX [Gammaproteobacteria bacterium]|nr:regulatory protein RecX [Gammaproteobacteria bacterium]
MSEAKKGRSLRRIALDFLARREHSQQELRQKLKARNDDAEAVEAVLQQLRDERLQSDERFTESYVTHRFNAGIGPFKTRYELRQRGIDDLLVDSFLEPLADEWEQMMRQQRARKFGETLPADTAACMKQARFLQNRGFSPESVMRLFR